MATFRFTARCLFKSNPQRLSTATALTLCIAPASLLAQEQPGGQGQNQEQPSAQGQTVVQENAAPQNADAPGVAPIPLVPEESTWDSFHGQLNAQKYSPLDQITANNVGNLEKVWEVHTSDVSDGSGELPATVWSATPVFANDTLYVGTPFYRILALDPATGEEKWSFDTQSSLEALTQPALKNRGVAYWQAEDPVAGEPCQKIIYMGTMDAQLFAIDADSGEKCENFANNGVLDVNQWNDIHDKWPLSLLQPSPWWVTI